MVYDVCESISENGHLVDIPLVRNTSHGIAYNIMYYVCNQPFEISTKRIQRIRVEFANTAVENHVFPFSVRYVKS